MIKIPIEVSNRHVHLSRKDIDVLFGKGYQLKVRRELSQPGEFAAEEKITLENSGNTIENVRVIGPERKRTQVELLKSDCSRLSLNAPVCDSGNLEKSPGIKLIGPKGEVKIKKGVIVAQRHLHASEEDAKILKIKDKQIVKIKVNDFIFDNVLVRVNKNYKLAVHIDKDEGESAGVKQGDYGELC
jgi:putative phosphotransacetylase